MTLTSYSFTFGIFLFLFTHIHVTGMLLMVAVLMTLTSYVVIFLWTSTQSESMLLGKTLTFVTGDWEGWYVWWIFQWTPCTTPRNSPLFVHLPMMNHQLLPLIWIWCFPMMMSSGTCTELGVSKAGNFRLSSPSGTHNVIPISSTQEKISRCSLKYIYWEEGVGV